MMLLTKNNLMKEKTMPESVLKHKVIVMIIELVKYLYSILGGRIEKLQKINSQELQCAVLAETC